MVKQRDQNYQSLPEFERALLNFIHMFKGHVLTDSRMLLFSSNLAESEIPDDNENANATNTIDGVYNESQNAYNTLA